jgi:hypothetical protein
MVPSHLYQHNMSATLLETNGKSSSSKHTKHMKLKYIFVKDKIDQGEITVEQCPTDQMWSDIDIKPKQGLAFHEFRGQIMGIPADYNYDEYKILCHTRPMEYPAPIKLMLLVSSPKQNALQECVGGSTNGRRGAGGNMTSDVAADGNVATLAAGSNVASGVAILRHGRGCLSR